MKKNFGPLFLLCCFCAACSTGVKQYDKTPVMQAGQAVGADAAGQGCAYSFFLKGQAEEQEGDIDAAMESFQRALACDENADHIRNRLAMLLSRAGRHEQATVLMEEVVARNPDDIKSKGVLAGLYAHSGALDKAIEIYTDLLKDQPDNLSVMLMLGTLYARGEKFGQAQKVFEALIAKDPEAYFGYYYLARIHREVRSFGKAAAAYEKALAISWSLGLAFEMAEFYEGQQQYDKALNVYRQMVKEDEPNEQARRKIASLYLEMGKVDKAIKELQKLRRYVEDTKQVDLVIGRVMLQHKRYKAAVQHFGTLLRQDPNFDTARYLLAYAYHELGQKGKAEHLLQDMPPSSQKYEDAVLFLVTMLRDDKNYTGIEKLLKKNIADHKSRKISFYVALASLYEEQNKIDAAKKVYGEAFEAFPENTKVLFEYGLFLDGIGEQDEALASMEKILTISPDDPYALNYVGYTWADNDMKLDKALEYIKKAITLQPDDGFIRDSLGWVYFKLGEYDKAVVELEKAVSLKKDDPTIHEHLADAYLKIGRKKQAVQVLEMSLKLYRDKEKQARVRRKLEKLKK